MAAITNRETVDTFLDKATIFTWVLTSADPIGDLIELPGWADRSIQSFGTFAGGSVVEAEGSNENPVDPPANFSPLNDHFGTPIAQSVAGLDGIAENTRVIRPILNPVGVAATITVKIMVRRQP